MKTITGNKPLPGMVKPPWFKSVVARQEVTAQKSLSSLNMKHNNTNNIDSIQYLRQAIA
jgi:hypothetical protein